MANSDHVGQHRYRTFNHSKKFYWRVLPQGFYQEVKIINGEKGNLFSKQGGELAGTLPLFRSNLIRAWGGDGYSLCIAACLRACTSFWLQIETGDNNSPWSRKGLGRFFGLMQHTIILHGAQTSILSVIFLYSQLVRTRLSNATAMVCRGRGLHNL